MKIYLFLKTFSENITPILTCSNTREKLSKNNFYRRLLSGYYMTVACSTSLKNQPNDLAIAVRCRIVLAKIKDKKFYF